MDTLFHHLRSASLPTLISLAQAAPGDDSAAMNEIIRKFEPFTRGLARGMTISEKDLYDDVANACRFGLVRAVRRHDTSRAGFPAYAERFMRGAGLRRVKQLHRLTSVEECEDPVESFEEATIDRLAPWGDGPVAQAVRKLSPPQQRIATLRYVHDAPLELIASASGTSVSAVSQRLSTIHRKIELAFAA